MNNKKNIKQSTSKLITELPAALFHDIASLIDDARKHVAREYSSTQAILCW